jgi:hypothetical protein
LQLETLATTSGNYQEEHIPSWRGDKTQKFEVMSDDDQGVKENGRKEGGRK